MAETVFQRPQFNLQPDPKGERMYANVSNRMEVVRNGRAHHVAVAVPTGLFSLMRDVFNSPIDNLYTLALDQVGDRYVLSLICDEADQLYDLWSYSEASAPAWVFVSEFRLK